MIHMITIVCSISSNKRDPAGRNLFLTCVSDLAIECRDYDLLFGKMQRNGVHSRGLIDQFDSNEIDVQKAYELVGDELIKRGLFEDAIKLYDLAKVSANVSYYFFLNVHLSKCSFSIPVPFLFIFLDRRAMSSLPFDFAVTGCASGKSERFIA